MAEKKFKCGYPNPGPQNISVKEAIANLSVMPEELEVDNLLPFMSDKEWEVERTKGDYHHVIIGSSFCARGFCHSVLEKRPNSKILIIERGEYVRPEVFQDLSPLDLRRVEKDTESFHWKVVHEEGEHIQYVRGMNNLFGGRSAFWKAWCPKPTREEMSDWPDKVITKLDKYFPAAKELLNVQPVDTITENGHQLFGELQEVIIQALKRAPSDIEEITEVQHAPLAVTENKCR